MKFAKRIITLMIIPMLFLAACSGLPLSFSFPVQKPAVVAVTKPVPATTTAPTTAPTSVPTSADAASPTSDPTRAATAQTAKVKDVATTQTLQSATGDLVSLQTALEAVFQKVNPSVVSIQVVEQAAATGNGRRGFQNSTPSMALGSGFVWDKSGHIVTNNHVVSGATSIKVTFSDGTTYDATVVGTDLNSDLAVVKINAPAAALIPVEVADSTQVQVGQIAIAIGNPFGLQNTMTQGIISALSRTLPVGLDNPNQTGPTYNIPDIIQTDASINPGNSGGVLVDIQGQLIGIPSAIESPSNTSAGIGFVIPSEIVSKVVPVLIEKGSFAHPYLGVQGTDMNAEFAKAMSLDAKQMGALIIDVTAGGPAATAGIKGGSQAVTINGQDINLGGDVIVAVNGQPITQFNQLAAYLFVHTSPGDKVTLTILRQGKQISVTVTLGSLPTQ